MKTLCLLLSTFCLFTLSVTAQETIAAQDSGRVEIVFNAPSAYLVVDNDFDKIRSITSGESVTLLAGTRYISLALPHTKPSKTYVRVLKDSTIEYSVEFSHEELTPAVFNNNFATAAYYNANIMVLTDPDTEIFYSDSLVGSGFAIVNSEMRFPEITLIDNQGYKKNVSARIPGQFSVTEYYVRPEKAKSRSYSIVPGASQFYKNQPLKGLAFSLGSVGFATLSFLNSQKYNSDLDSYYKLLVEYRSTEVESEAFRLGNELEVANDDLRSLDRSRKLFLGLAITAYVGSIVDAFLSTPKGGYSNPKPIEFYLNQDVIGESIIHTANVKVKLGK